jgi:predicted Zn-dependent protease
MRTVGLLFLLTGVALAQPRPEPGKGVNFYSVEKEIALGKQLAAEFRKDSRSIENAAVSAYVNGIGQRVAAQIGGPPFTYVFELVAGDTSPIHEVAAFPGGALFIPASLILAANNEDELAAMLAHAIAHVAARHGTRMATKGEIANMAGIPLVFVGGWTGNAVRQNQSLALPLAFQQFWRQSELEADRLAVSSMANAGYDPDGLAQYVERVQPADQVPFSSSALPARADRVDLIRKAIAGLPPRTYGPNQRLEQMQEILRQSSR